MKVYNPGENGPLTIDWDDEVKQRILRQLSHMRPSDNCTLLFSNCTVQTFVGNVREWCGNESGFPDAYDPSVHKLAEMS